MARVEMLWLVLGFAAAGIALTVVCLKVKEISIGVSTVAPADRGDRDVTMSLCSRVNRLASWVRSRWGWILIATMLVIVIVLPLLIPGASYFWSYRGFLSLFRDDLGLGAALAAVLALICAFFDVIATPFALWWLVTGRRPIRGFIAILIVFGTTPLLHAMLNSNFNQTTGEAQKWYVWRAGGAIILSDNGGFDPVSGTEKRRLTPQIADIIERQKKGLYPKHIVDDPQHLLFFSPSTGQPQVWYSVHPDGSYFLYDSEGFDPDNGALLLPVTEQVIAETRLHAADVAVQARAQEIARANQQEAEAKARAHQDMLNLFNASGFQAGAIIVGVRARKADDPISAQASREVVRQLLAVLRSDRLPAAEFMPEVYGSIYFDALLRGDTRILAEVGLADKARATVLMMVVCSCRQAESIGGAVSCSIEVDTRVIDAGGIASVSAEWVEPGAATTQEGAIVRAAQLVFERHRLPLVMR